MKTIETALSIQNALYDEAAKLARELQISPNELFNQAIQEYLQRHRQQSLLQHFNEAYEDGLDSEEEVVLERMRLHQRQLLEQDA